MATQKYSVVESAAIKHAQEFHVQCLADYSRPLLEKDPTGRSGGNPESIKDPLSCIPSPAWTKILNLTIENNKPHDGWRSGQATVLVGFREGKSRYLVELKGTETDQRLGVSIMALVKVERHSAS